MTLKPGWLSRQFATVNAEIREWPSWMRREAGFAEPNLRKRKMMAKMTALEWAKELKSGMVSVDFLQGRLY